MPARGASASPIVVRAEKIGFAYGSRHVLHDVDLVAREGEVLGLVGPNGSGKTTALGVLHGLLVPQSGTVELLGKDLARYSGRERARLVATVSQEAAGDMPVSVADVVLLGRIPHGGGTRATRDADLEIAARALRSLGILHLARQEFTTLSGGERQRVLIARALTQQPRLLLMDEPTNHLDIGSQHRVMQQVRAQHVTTVVVLHDLNLASRYCDRVAVLSRGRIVADGAPADVLTEELVDSTYDVHSDARHADDGMLQFLFRV